MNLFKKKIVFETTIPGVDKLMPIIPAKEYRHPWVSRALDDYAKIRAQPGFGTERSLHTARCPGIFKLQRHGWILRTWQDICIETNGDGENFNWTTPANQILLNKEPFVSSHSPDQLYQFMDNWPSNTLKSLIKINTSWRCVVPKGYYLLEMPIPYSDDNRFTTVPGYFSRETGPAQMNVQLLWHVLNGKTLIKAGTPIAQYILVPKEEVDMEIVTVGNKASIHQLFYLSDNQRFVKNFNHIKKIFGGDDD